MIILGFSSKKQGGKSTAVKDIMAKLYNKMCLSDIGIISFADELKIILCRTLVPYDWIDRGTDPIAWVEDNKNTMLPCGLTVRQALQEIGTKWFRSRWPETWINSWKGRTRGYRVVLVADIRFPNEVRAVQDMGGHVIRFTRAPFAEEDQDASETALDRMQELTHAKFNQLTIMGHVDEDTTRFDALLDNRRMTIPEQNFAVWSLLEEKGWLKNI